MAHIGWEYRKIDLNDAGRGNEDIDLLCEAGMHGWELVVILPNNVAYLKRKRIGFESEMQIDESAREEGSENVGDVKPKYRDPATGDTWSGRGRMARWIKRKLDAGEDIEKYRT